MLGLRRLWRGELPLEVAFWTWAVGGGLAINVVTSVLFLALMSADRPLLAVVVGYGPSVPYNIVAAVGVWRAADRYPGERRWAELARFVTVVGAIVLCVT